MASAKDIAASVPAPDKIGKGYAADDGDEMPGENETDESKAAKVSLMQEFLDILGLKGVDAEAACDALEAYIDSR